MIKQEKIEQRNDFLHIITHGNNPVFKSIIEDEEIDKITLSFEFDYSAEKSYIVISNGKQEILLQTPKVPIFTSNSNLVAVMAANTQQIIDSWFNALKETFEWNILTIYCKDIPIEITNTCFYKAKMFFTDHFVNGDCKIFIAHPYIIEKYPYDYKMIKQIEYLNNSYKEMKYDEYIEKHKLFVREKYVGWQTKN